VRLDDEGARLRGERRSRNSNTDEGRGSSTAVRLGFRVLETEDEKGKCRGEIHGGPRSPQNRRLSFMLGDGC